MEPCGTSIILAKVTAYHSGVHPQDHLKLKFWVLRGCCMLCWLLRVLFTACLSDRVRLQGT